MRWRADKLPRNVEWTKEKRRISEKGSFCYDAFDMGVSNNNGTPKSSILVGFSIIFTIHIGGLPLCLETPIYFLGMCCRRNDYRRYREIAVSRNHGARRSFCCVCEDSVVGWTWAWQFFVTFLGCLSDLLERWSDLQLRDKKVTLNHLGVNFFNNLL